MTDHAAELQRAGEAYQQARAEADRIMVQPRDNLTEAVRAAYAAGRRKADILRDIGHVWSGTWLNEVVQDITPPPIPPRHAPARRTARKAP